MNKYFSIPESLLTVAEEVEAQIRPQFKAVESIRQHNVAKVLKAFIDARVGEEHLHGTTGYGHGDMGRDKLEEVFARIAGAEDALVRVQMVSGTHAISTALFGILRPGDELLYVTGKPYDTFDEVIGLRGEGQGSLKEWGIDYRHIDLKENGKVDLEAIEKGIGSKTKVAAIQRSRGYHWRPSITMAELQKIISVVKKKNPEIICFVDNCYCEFVEMQEPCEVGADLIAGSLIKNPGGGIAPMGGYIAGKKELVKKAAYRLTAPGIGKDGGASLEVNRLFFQGLFNAPQMVGEAMKAAIFASTLLEKLGFTVSPTPGEMRADIIQAIQLGSPEKLVAFCRALQAHSPVQAYVRPEPEHIPGYKDKVVMAGGTFIEGSTIELSADGPLRDPYVAYLQGGLSYAHAKISILKAVEKILDSK